MHLKFLFQLLWQNKIEDQRLEDQENKQEMNSNRRPMYRAKGDSEKETYNTKKPKHKGEILKINPEILSVKEKHQVENVYYEMKPSLTKSPPPNDLKYGDEYYTRTNQDSIFQGGEGAASLISFSSLTSSENGSGHTSAPESIVEVDTVIESIIAKGCVDEVLDSLQPLSCSEYGCEQMRSSGCLPFLIQQLHIQPAYEEHCRPARDTRQRVLNILTNIVKNQSSVQRGRRESKILDILWTIRQYTDLLRDLMKAYESNSQVSARANEIGCENVKTTILKRGKNVKSVILCGKIIFILGKNV